MKWLNLARLSRTGMLALLAAPAGAGAQPPITEREIHAIGVDAYLSLYPVVTMDITRRVATPLANWLDVTLRTYDERVVPLTVGIARRWGRLAAKLGNKQLDLAIAATALEHGLIVVTPNVSDFQPTGVPIFNPFDPQPRRKA